MLLKSLRLENIRSYISQTIDFQDGSTLLIGDIGSGKTTILLAIEFAFFGIIKGDVSGATLLRHGKKEGLVELAFEINGQEIIIQRKLKFSKDVVSQDSGKLTVNGSSSDLTPVELKSKILELFGYPEDLLNKNTSIIYRYTVYTPQEEMKKILQESKDDRLDTLRKIFNIDKYKRIRENALIYAKDLRNTKKNIEVQIQDLEKINEQLEISKKLKTLLDENETKEKTINEELKVTIEQKKSELTSYEENISKLNTMKKDLEISTLNIKNKELELDKNNKELSMTNYRIGEYQNKLKDLEIIDDEETIKQKLSDAEDKFNKIKNAKEIIGKRLEDKERDIKNLILEDVSLLKQKQSIIVKQLESKPLKEKYLENANSLFEKNLIELNIINMKRTDSVKVVDQLKDLSTCPVCLQNVDFSHKVKILDKEHANIYLYERRFNDIQNKKTELNRNVLELKAEIELLRNSEIELKEITTKLANIEKQEESKIMIEREFEELKLKKEKLDKMDVNILLEVISKSRKLLSNIEAKKHIDESLKEKIAKREELIELISKLSEELKTRKTLHLELHNNIKSYDNIEKEYIIIKTNLELINKEFITNSIKLSSLTKDIESINTEIKKLSEDIELKNKLKDKITYIGELNYWITEHLVNLTSTIEKAVMQKIHIEFNELFQKWFSMLLEDESINARIDEEFTPLIVQDGFDTEIASLSGGEKTSVALAYRLALNKVINDLINNINTKELLILDEPTDGFSSEQLDKMRSVLYELNVKQLIMVSHEAKMESYVNNIIRINKNEHVSNVII